MIMIDMIMIDIWLVDGVNQTINVDHDWILVSQSIDSLSLEDLWQTSSETMLIYPIAQQTQSQDNNTVFANLASQNDDRDEFLS